MKWLAIETSTDRASLALLTGKELRMESLTHQKTHAELLLPRIDKLLVDASLSLTQLDGIVFGCGPGSFTGLRIACSIAKGLGFAHDLGLIPVSSLTAIAYSIQSQKEYENSPVLAVLDARMQQMYWSYVSKQGISSSAFVNKVDEIRLPSSEPFILAGVGIPLYWEQFPKRLKALLCQSIEAYPTADQLIHFALWANLKPISAVLAEPIYVRNQVT